MNCAHLYIDEHMAQNIIYSQKVPDIAAFHSNGGTYGNARPTLTQWIEHICAQMNIWPTICVVKKFPIWRRFTLMAGHRGKHAQHNPLDCA
jgi:hypothetical protein